MSDSTTAPGYTVDKFVRVRGWVWDVSMRHEEKTTGKHDFLQN